MRAFNQRWKHNPFWGGDGRYFYVHNQADVTVSVVDSTLLTSGNYVGAGVWTSDPVVATISLTASKSFETLVYDARRQQVLVIGNAWIDIIDADPASGSFNTVINSGSIESKLGGTSICGCIIEPLDLLMANSSSGAWVITELRDLFNTNGYVTYGRSIPSLGAQPAWCLYDPRDHTVVVGTGSGAYGVTFNERLSVPNPKFTEDLLIPKVQYIAATGSACFFNPYRDSIFDSSTSTIYEHLRSEDGYVFSISINNQAGSIAAHWNKNKIYGTVVNSLNVTPYNFETMSAGSAISRSAVGGVEVGASQLMLNGDESVLLIMPCNTGSSSNISHVHVIDTTTDAYVGYVNVGNRAANRTRKIYLVRNRSNFSL